jgi:hypothetical protein
MIRGTQPHFVVPPVETISEEPGLAAAGRDLKVKPVAVANPHRPGDAARMLCGCDCFGG